jgi:hypothetical protein
MHRVTTMVTVLFIAAAQGGTGTVEAQGLIADGQRADVVPLKDHPKYAYLRSEIERLSRSSIFECRNISMAARHWWEKNRVYGFTERMGVADAVSGFTGYLAGEARAPRSGDAADTAYVMHLYLANRTKSEIMKTFRHESAHAAGITDERAARAWAEECR